MFPTTRHWLTVPLTLALLIPATGLRAQEDRPAAGDLRTKLDSVLEEQQRLRVENQQMRDEIDELRAMTDENWLTEARAEEIRSLVEDVLLDADTRAGHLQDGLTAGWSEHFFLASPDGRFKLEIDGLLQFRWIYSYRDQTDRHRNGFEISRAKLTFRGHVFNPDLTYLIRTDATRDEPGLVTGLYYLQDAWIGWQLNDDWSVRFGQFKAPFMREELVDSANQLAIERSLISRSLSLRRTQGIELTYADGTSKFQFMINDGGTDQIGGFGSVGGGTQPINGAALVEDVEFSFTTRYEALVAGDWRQFRTLTSPPGEEFGMLWGIAGHYQQTENTGVGIARGQDRWLALTSDLSVDWGGATLFVSGTWEYVDNSAFGNINIWGVVVQGGVYLTQKLEVYARWEYGAWDEFSDIDLNVITFGTNYYIDGEDVKFSADIGIGINSVNAFWDSEFAGWREEGADANPQIVFRTQLQLLF